MDNCRPLDQDVPEIPDCMMPVMYWDPGLEWLFTERGEAVRGVEGGPVGSRLMAGVHCLRSQALQSFHRQSSDPDYILS
jgi:hypothetical protein